MPPHTVDMRRKKCRKCSAAQLQVNQLQPLSGTSHPEPTPSTHRRQPRSKTATTHLPAAASPHWKYLQTGADMWTVCWTEEWRERGGRGYLSLYVSYVWHVAWCRSLNAWHCWCTESTAILEVHHPQNVCITSWQGCMQLGISLNLCSRSRKPHIQFSSTDPLMKKFLAGHILTNHAHYLVVMSYMSYTVSTVWHGEIKKAFNGSIFSLLFHQITLMWTIFRFS